jgi:hypothetical protein
MSTLGGATGTERHGQADRDLDGSNADHSVLANRLFQEIEGHGGSFRRFQETG